MVDVGSLARLSHFIQMELQAGDTVVVVDSAHEYVGAQGVVTQMNSAAAIAGQFAYQVEIFTEGKQPVRWWFSRVQLSPAFKDESPEVSRGPAEALSPPPREEKAETITVNGIIITVREGVHHKAAKLALAAERERVEYQPRSSGGASLSQRRREVSSERRALSQRPQSASAARGGLNPAPHSRPQSASAARSGLSPAPPSRPQSASAARSDLNPVPPSRPQSAKPGPRPQSAKGPRSLGTERNASPPRRAPGSAPFALRRPASPPAVEPACEECQPDPAPDTAVSSPRQDSAPGGASPPPGHSPDRESCSSSPGRLVARDEGTPRERRVAADQQGWREPDEQHETRVQTFRRWVSGKRTRAVLYTHAHSFATLHLPHLTCHASPATCPHLPRP